MTNTAILAVSALLVFAYLLDVFGRRTRLPPVVLLILTGIAARPVLEGFDLPGLAALAPARERAAAGRLPAGAAARPMAASPGGASGAFSPESALQEAA